MVYRLAYQPLAEASVLILLIVSVAVHVAMVGLGLLVFGAEGFRNAGFFRGNDRTGCAECQCPVAVVIGCSVALIVLLYLLFERTITARRCARPRSIGWARG